MTVIVDHPFPRIEIDVALLRRITVLLVPGQLDAAEIDKARPIAIAIGLIQPGLPRTERGSE
jgi:hypothetical protein